MVCSMMKVMAGVFAHRCSLTNYGDSRYDGDVGSANVMYTEESRKEVMALLDKKLAYVDPSGRLIASAAIATAELVCFNLTR